jgi:hypothetical protein
MQTLQIIPFYSVKVHYHVNGAIKSEYHYFRTEEAALQHRDEVNVEWEKMFPWNKLPKVHETIETVNALYDPLTENMFILPMPVKPHLKYDNEKK